MFNANTLLTASIFIFFIFTQAAMAKSDLVSLQLQQAVDANCDGIIDSPYSTNNNLSLLPKQCIMYKVTAKNTSQQTLKELVITGKIPPYTQLKEHSIFVYQDDKLELNVIYQDLNSAQINAKLTKLLPLKTITLFYSVRLE